MSSSWNFHSSIYKYLPLCCNVNAIKHHRHTRIAIFYCSVSLLLCIYLNKSIEGFAKAGDMFHPGDHLLLCDVSPDEKESPLVSPPQNWEGGGGRGEPSWNEGRFGPSCWKSWISDPRLPLPLPPLEPSSSPVERKVTNRLIQNINQATSQLLSWKMFQGKTTSSEKITYLAQMSKHEWLQMFQQVNYGEGIFFKVVLEC